MGLKSTTALLALVCSFVLVQAASAGPSIDPCDLPKDLQAVVARKYPGSGAGSLQGRVWEKGASCQPRCYRLLRLRVVGHCLRLDEQQCG